MLCQCDAACTDAANRQDAPRGVIEARAREVDGEVLFEAARNDLKNAGRVLAAANRARGTVEQAQAIELHSHSLFSALAVVDVGVGTEPADDGARRIAERHAAGFEPPVHAVVTPDPGLDVVRDPSLQRYLPVTADSLPILGVNDVHPTQPQIGLLGLACVPRPLGAHILAPAVRSEGPHEIRQGLDERRHALLARAQLRFGRLAIRDVAQKGAEAHSRAFG